MNAAQRLAAIAGTAVLALAVVPITTATPAAAAAKCTKPQSIAKSWGKVTYTVCTVVYTSGNKAQNVSGTVTDLKTDGYKVNASFKWNHPVVDNYERYTTGTSLSFESDYHLVEGSVYPNLFQTKA